MATNAMPMQPAINIRVFRNGDEFFMGKRFVISTRTTKDFDSFLNEVTWGLKASFGAVRKLHTPVNGHKIQDLSALENNNIYVAAGSEKFKKKSYNEHLSPRRLAAGTVKASTFAGPIQPVTHSKIRRSARIRHIYVGTKTIYVYRNGDDKELPLRMLLRYRSLQNFETVLTEINSKVNLLNGVAIRRLYKMTGERLTDCSEIDSEGKYVAAGTERFKKVAYGQWEPSALLSPRHIKKPLPPIKSKSPPQKSSLPAKPKPTTVKKRPEKKKKRVEKSAEQKEADSVFHHKPTTVKRSREKDQHLNYDDDPNAVFRAKEGNSETDGAREVEDTGETAIDLPIDQIAAEEVDEEIGENLPMNQESKSPEPYKSSSPARKTPSPTEVPDDYTEEKPRSPEDKVMKNPQRRKQKKSIQTTTQGTKSSPATTVNNLPTRKTGKTPPKQTNSVKKPSTDEPPKTPVQTKKATRVMPPENPPVNPPENPPARTPPPRTMTPLARSPTQPPQTTSPMPRNPIPPSTMNPLARIPTPPSRTNSPLARTPTPPSRTNSPPARTPTPPPTTTTPPTRTTTPPSKTPTEKAIPSTRQEEATTPQPDRNPEPNESSLSVRESTRSLTNAQQKEPYDFDVTKPQLLNDNQNGTLANAQDVSEG